MDNYIEISIYQTYDELTNIAVKAKNEMKLYG